MKPSCSASRGAALPPHANVQPKAPEPIAESCCSLHEVISPLASGDPPLAQVESSQYVSAAQRCQLPVSSTTAALPPPLKFATATGPGTRRSSKETCRGSFVGPPRLQPEKGRLGHCALRTEASAGRHGGTAVPAPPAVPLHNPRQPWRAAPTPGRVACQRYFFRLCGTSATSHRRSAACVLRPLT